MRQTVRTVCQGCHPECGVLVHVENGRVTKIEGDPAHPSSRGFICIKGQNYSEVLYHADRVKYPLKRTGNKAEGKWQRISWDQALDEIATKLTEIRETYGPQSIATYHGTGPRAADSATERLAAALGTPNVISTDFHICLIPSIVAETSTVGHSIMMEHGPDYLSANCILVFGGNPVISHPPRGVELLESKRKRNARLIVVDPRRIPLASEADLWLQIRPGTDAALALSMIHVIINEELYDNDFVNNWCYGFNELKERVKDYPPEKVAEITWLPDDMIRQAARLYATTKPAVLHHRVATEHNLSSTQTDRALAILVAITGNLDVKGGNLLPVSKRKNGSPSGFRHFTIPIEVEEKRIGSKEFPLISGTGAPFPFVHAALAAEAMLIGKPYWIKAAYFAGANPVINMQNTKKTWQALKNLELNVVTDFFMTPTAELADYVLPAATWLERNDLCDTTYMNCTSARQKVVGPLFECRDDHEIVIDLVQRISWADRSYLPWNSVDEWNESMVNGLGMTFKELQTRGYVTFPVIYKKYEKDGFRTPTKKVELYSTIFEKHGYDPLPGFVEPPESPVSTPELFKEFPLILITGARYIEYYNSIGYQIPTLRKRVPDPEIEVHPDTARNSNLNDGDWVWVETPKVAGERVKLKVKLTSGIDPRVVHAAHGWWFPEKPAPEHGCFDSNISVLLSDGDPREQICGSVPLRGTLCKIYK